MLKRMLVHFLEQTLHQVSVMNSTVYSTISNQSKMVVDVGTSAMEPGICVMEPSPVCFGVF